MTDSMGHESSDRSNGLSPEGAANGASLTLMSTPETAADGRGAIAGCISEPMPESTILCALSKPARTETAAWPPSLEPGDRGSLDETPPLQAIPQNASPGTTQQSASRYPDAEYTVGFEVDQRHTCTGRAADGISDRPPNPTTVISQRPNLSSTPKEGSVQDPDSRRDEASHLRRRKPGRPVRRSARRQAEMSDCSSSIDSVEGGDGHTGGDSHDEHSPTEGALGLPVGGRAASTRRASGKIPAVSSSALQNRQSRGQKPHLKALHGEGDDYILSRSRKRSRREQEFLDVGGGNEWSAKRQRSAESQTTSVGECAPSRQEFPAGDPEEGRNNADDRCRGSGNRFPEGSDLRLNEDEFDIVSRAYRKYRVDGNEPPIFEFPQLRSYMERLARHLRRQVADLDRLCTVYGDRAHPTPIDFHTVLDRVILLHRQLGSASTATADTESASHRLPIDGYVSRGSSNIIKALASGNLLEALRKDWPSSSEAAVLIHSCLSIIGSIASSHLSDKPNSLPSSGRHNGDHEERFDEYSDEAVGEDGLTEDEHCKDGGRGKRLRWVTSEERLLKRWIKEGKELLWIASKLGRTEAAVRQHWNRCTKRMRG